MKEASGGETKERMRLLEGKQGLIVYILAAVFSFFYIYTAGFGLISTEIHRGAYLLFTMLLVFMLYSSLPRCPILTINSATRPVDIS